MAKSVTPEEFVKVWQEAESAEVVALACGLTIGSTCSRASRYRKLGVPLKHMSGVRTQIDVESLKLIASSSLAAYSHIVPKKQRS